jgi:RNA polymerase sigma-70 factor (ECF subfamily)
MDERLARRTAPSDESRAFFAERVEACMDALYGAALRLTRSPIDAEELVAETVAKAWSAIGTLEDPGRFRPWIFRVLRNGFISEYRRKSAEPAIASLEDCVDDDGDLVSLLNEQPDDFLKWWAHPEKALVNKLLGEKIQAAMDDLPEAFRVTILLVNVDGLSYDEAAEALGVPPGTVRSRMKRGRTLLQKALWQQARDAGLATTDPQKAAAP